MPAEDTVQIAAAPPRAGRREWVGLGAIALACMLYVMDLTILHLAIPEIIALIIEVGPGRATVIGYTTPVVAVVLGVALLDERLTGSAIAGVVLILAGSYLATRNPMSRALDPSGAGQRCQASLGEGRTSRWPS